MTSDKKETDLSKEFKIRSEISEKIRLLSWIYNYGFEEALNKARSHQKEYVKKFKNYNDNQIEKEISNLKKELHKRTFPNPSQP